MVQRLGSPTVYTGGAGNIPIASEVYRSWHLYGRQRDILFSEAKSLNKTMDAMDTEKVPSKSADREAAAGRSGRQIDRRTQKQKGQIGQKRIYGRTNPGLC